MQRTQDNCIHTFTGQQFWPLAARVEDVRITDIAHALSMKCRYTGHTREFYSVAQHCVLASQNCNHPKWALMHDAAEAYLPDVARPIKPEIPGFEEMEEKLLSVIASKFNLAMPFPPEVHRIDMRMLMTEWRDLMPEGSSIVGVDASPLPFQINCWSPEKAKKLFLSRFDELFPPF